MLFVRLHGNRRTWVDCGRPGVPTCCAFKWPVWGVPLNDDDVRSNQMKEIMKEHRHVQNTAVIERQRERERLFIKQNCIKIHVYE